MKNPNFWTNPSMRSMDQNVSERMERGLSDVARSGGEPDTCEDLRRYSMSMDQTVMLPSSQYKGVVARPNGPWGAKIYEKNQRLWLGALNSEVDATRAYDGAFLKFRTQDAITDFSPVRDGDQETRFSRMHTGKIIDVVTAAHSAAMNNAEEPSWTEGSDLRDDLCQGMQRVVDGNANASAVVACLPGEHLFDKAVTPSDVGKLNRLVIPKQHAEKYFPLDINACEKGLLLDFQDNTGKVWRFRYSYWNSSQSYVLTKGWSRFVKDKKLEAGDIVSFQRGLAESHQLYINCRRRPSCQATQRIDRRSQQSKGGMVYPVFGSSSLNPFNSGAQATVLYNSQWMPIFWPRSSNPDSLTQFTNSHSVSPLVKKVDAMWSPSTVTPLNGTPPFYLSTSPTKTTAQSKSHDIISGGLHRFHNSQNSGDPLVNPAPPSVAQEWEGPEGNARSNLDPTTKKGVRLFGVILTEPQRLSAQHQGQLNLFPW